MGKNKGLTFYKRKKRISPILIKEIFSWLFGLLAAVFLAGVLTFFYGMSTNVVGVSMEPTLGNSQRILIDRFIYTLTLPKVGDVVVFLPNGNENTHYYVKRVVAVPGDTVQIVNGVLYVNEEPSQEITTKMVDPGIADNALVLAVGEYFCIGDNPNNSEDSRSANIGPVKEKDMIGKAWFRMKDENIDTGFIK
jgi:signal peptidase I